MFLTDARELGAREPEDRLGLESLVVCPFGQGPHLFDHAVATDTDSESAAAIRPLASFSALELGHSLRPKNSA